MKWFRGISFLVMFALFFSACNPFRPAYPATYTPPAASPTHQVITLQPTHTLPPTSTPKPVSSPATPVPHTSALSVIWMINAADQTIVGIDPVSQKIAATVEVDGTPQDIVTGENGIWVVTHIDPEHSILIRIDPYSRLTSSHIPAMEGEATIVTAGEGFVWLGVAKGYTLNEAAGGGVEYSRLGAVMQIDPNPSKITQSFDIPAQPVDIFPEENIIWVLANKNTTSLISKIDLKEQTVTSLPQENLSTTKPQKFAQFTKLGSWLWMTPQDSFSHFIYQVDSSTGQIHDTIRVGYLLKDSAIQITQDGINLWAALRSGKVLKIDPVSREVAASISTGASNLTDIFYSSGFVWAIDEEESRVYQIDAKTEEIVSSYSTGSLPGARPTPTITVTTNPDMIWALCKDAFQTHLQVGIQAVVNSDISIPSRIREEAGSDALIKGYIEQGDVVNILEGPVCLNGWVWWKVASISTGMTGWTSEGDWDEYWLVPYKY